MRYEYYKDKRGKWRWQSFARNGNILSDSGQGYSTKHGCKRALYRYKQQSMYAPIRPRNA